MLRDLIDTYKSESSKIVLGLDTEEVESFVSAILEAYENESTVFACGNGGNASAVQNLVVDMNMHPFVSDDKGKANASRNLFNCVSLTSCTATITGISNDLGYQHIFSEQLRYQGRAGDVLFCITVIHVRGEDSTFPGQVGKNNNNFHFEDCISKVTHIAVGLLKQKVQNENNS